MTKKSSIISVHNRVTLAKMLAKETLKLLTDPKKLLEDEAPLDNKTVVMFVGELIHGVLYSVLNDKPLKYEGEELYNHVHTSYTNVKRDIAEKIGQAFTTAIKDFSGKDLVYTCDISPLPDRNKSQDN